jgi:hypothetical protein
MLCEVRDARPREYSNHQTRLRTCRLTRAEKFKPSSVDLRGRTLAEQCVRVLPRTQTPAAGQRSVAWATHHRASAAGEHQRDEDLGHRPARKLDLRRVCNTSLQNRSGRGGGLLFLNKIQQRLTLPSMSRSLTIPRVTSSCRKRTRRAMYARRLMDVASFAAITAASLSHHTRTLRVPSTPNERKVSTPVRATNSAGLGTAVFFFTQ